MNESNQEPSANEGLPAMPWGDSDEAFGARQADGLGLSGLFIEGDDGRFVSALEHLINRRAAEADAKE